MSQPGEVLRSVAKPGPVLIFVHNDIEPPVQTVLDLPVRADDGVQALRRDGLAEQVEGRLGGGLASPTR